MNFGRRSWVASIAWVGLATSCWAQNAPAPGQAPAVPSNGGVGSYRSAFDTYRRFDDAPVAPWRESNDTVGRVGGWRAYAREAAGMPAKEPVAAPVQAPHGAHPPPTAPAAGGHRH